MRSARSGSCGRPGWRWSSPDRLLAGRGAGLVGGLVGRSAVLAGLAGWSAGLGGGVWRGGGGGGGGGGGVWRGGWRVWRGGPRLWARPAGGSVGGWGGGSVRGPLDPLAEAHLAGERAVHRASGGQQLLRRGPAILPAQLIRLVDHQLVLAHSHPVDVRRPGLAGAGALHAGSTSELNSSPVGTLGKK